MIAKPYLKTRAIFTSIVIPLVLFGWIWVSRVPPSSLPTSAIEAPHEDFLAPGFTLESIESDMVTLSDLRGKPVILNFWASWCPPCRAEMPAFQQAWKEYSDSDLAIIAINALSQDSYANVINFIDQNQLEFPILLDADGTVSALYQVHSLPTTFILNREGVIDKVLIGGPIPLSLLRVEVDRLLQDDTYVPGN